MGETLADIARHERACGNKPKLVVKHTGDGLQHRSKIVLVTHNMQQAARCANQGAFFYLGEMIEAGSAQQMFTAPKLKQTQDYVTGRSD